jgi:hypothetical protein
MNRSMKRGPCLACGVVRGPQGFEDAHIVAAGVRGDGKDSGNGCDCAENKLRLCWTCHRLVVHGVKGGWKALVERAQRLNPAGAALLVASVKRAREHWYARNRGETACSAGTKAGAAARVRIQAAERAEERRTEHAGTQG